MSKIRKWSESYVSYGSTKVTPNGRDCAQCLRCLAVISNASLRPSTLKNIAIKSIPKGRMNDIDALSAKRIRYNLEATLPHLGFTVEEKPTLQWRYEVAYQIVKCKKPHNIVEKLIKLCVGKMVEITIGLKAKMNICRWIDNMAANVGQKVCSEIKQSTLQASIQMDLSADSAL